ncbi:amidohydrolase family protein [Lutibaculum baratangense]|uniref:Amidohydrolase-related domain-containing protein n=1 Tax=Lutibaculum baratangense AMV1 TaxID=631454 RepID=V4R1W0_9HYPH|nr:amidohydrolase family protein [Lutibaculum baratangense]ESR25892.1 hypothetical protein N177_1227 [Lutibaculum baratangense AMV1]
MAEIRITNCHIHTFTAEHAPRYYPAWPVVIFRWWPWLLRVVRFLFWFSPWQGVYQRLVRLEAFHDTGRRTHQEEIFREVRRHYPRDTRFVVLPVDMTPIGHGPVNRDIVAQHDELHRLAGHYRDSIIPFGTVHPDTPGSAAEFRRCVEELGFRGLKLYPKMGFRPDHPVLMSEVYPLCVDRNLPVITHCSRGGVRRKGWSQEEADRVTAPEAYLPVMEAFPTLRICLAHFGGDRDWRAYLDEGFDPDRPEEKERNWVSRIETMIRGEGWPNLWTDISYTLFNFQEYAPLLRLFLKEKDSRLCQRVLFGSDFYMTRQERLSEKAVSILLRDTLGEDLFRQIAETNPHEFLTGDGASGELVAVAASPSALPGT